uniref:Uncharacterized protein n=1 Tax=Picea glauca TaxID=3330 RepID=A0A101LXA2_PICGL|nr:hypothetical protein ABT39_MTgene6298 [Picea glauca]
MLGINDAIRGGSSDICFFTHMEGRGLAKKVEKPLIQLPELFRCIHSRRRSGCGVKMPVPDQEWARI